MCFSILERNFLKVVKSIVLGAVIQVPVIVWVGNSHVYASEVVGCTTNSTYLKFHPDNSSTCVPCSACPIAYGVVTACTNITDTVCEPCSNGMYNDVSDGSCKNCSHCVPGFYVYRKCIAYSDVMCTRCPEWYHSIEYDSSNCQPCKMCQRNELTSTECSWTNDTVCGNCVRDHFRDESTRECIPCSQCHGDVSVIVPECQEKLGHSQEVCQPLGYVPRTRTDAATTTISDYSSTVLTTYTSVADIEMSNAMLLVAILFTLVLLALLFFTTVVVMRRRRPQKVVRLCRDNIKKAGYHLTRNSNQDTEECCHCFVLSKNRCSSKSGSTTRFCVVDDAIEFKEFNYHKSTKRHCKAHQGLVEGDHCTYCDAEFGLCDNKESCQKYKAEIAGRDFHKEHLSTRTALRDEKSLSVNGKYDCLSMVDSGVETLSEFSEDTFLSVTRDDDAHAQGPVAPPTRSEHAQTETSGPVQHVVTIEK